jgi:hypothetical protein
MTKADRIAINRRALRYCKQQMALKDPETTQADNWIFGHLATFAMREARRAARAERARVINLAERAARLSALEKSALWDRHV